MKLSFRLGTCGRCGKPLGNPLTHVCVRSGRARRGRTRIRPKVSASVKCGTCGKPYANPLTHVCSVKSSLRSRRAAGRSQRRTAPKPPRVTVYGTDGKPRSAAHPYAACRDDDCDRRACVAYKDGFAEGYEDGFADGQAAAS